MKHYDPNLLSNHFNNYFSTIADTWISSICGCHPSSPIYLTNKINSTIFLHNVSIKEIQDIVNTIKSSYCAGTDAILKITC